MDKLVSFETAILAKEKGFDEVCLNNYALDGNSYDRKPIGLYAPTQSLLQTWLREIHGIHVVVFPFSFSGLQDEDISMRWNYRVYKLPIYSGSVTSIVDTCHFTTYNEALEAGLFEGLKLIII